MEVVHHGGKASVTGSCHELRADGQALLIDCGLFQGADERPLAVTGHFRTGSYVCP